MKYKIYTLSHPITNEIRYIGFTSKSLKTRLQGHISKARTTKLNIHLSNWLRILLNTGLKPKIELLDETDDNWQELEIYWIEQFKQWGFNLTNTSKGGDKTNLGIKLCKERIKKRPYKIFQYDFNGNLINKFQTRRDAAECMGVTPGNIGAIIKNNGCCKGYKFTLSDEPFFKKSETIRCSILQYDLQGNFIKEWLNPKQVQEKLNIKAANIIKVLKNKRTNAGGFQWKYSLIDKVINTDLVIKDYFETKSIIVTDINNKDIEFESSRKAAIYLDISTKLLCAILKNKIKNSKKLNGRKVRYK